MTMSMAKMSTCSNGCCSKRTRARTNRRTIRSSFLFPLSTSYIFMFVAIIIIMSTGDVQSYINIPALSHNHGMSSIRTRTTTAFIHPTKRRRRQQRQHNNNQNIDTASISTSTTTSLSYSSSLVLRSESITNSSAVSVSSVNPQLLIAKHSIIIITTAITTTTVRTMIG